jgi:tRNA 2-thiouridine synthesizing protein A
MGTFVEEYIMDSPDLAGVNVKKIVDARWVPCPGTLLGAKEGICRLLPGEVMEIHSHDPEAQRDISAWVGKVGHEFLGVLESEGYYRIFVKKKTPE